jgi:hypothetical protein
MKANELRIGNWLQYGVHVVPVKSIHIGIVFKKEVYIYVELNEKLNHYCVLIHDVKPIPITEEWLLKLGFVSNPYQDRYEKGRLHVECDQTKGEIYLWIQSMPHIKHVHQLQNLYFSLTGEELTIS